MWKRMLIRLSRSRRRRRSGRQPPRRADSAFQCVEEERMGGQWGPGGGQAQRYCLKCQTC